VKGHGIPAYPRRERDETNDVCMGLSPGLSIGVEKLGTSIRGFRQRCFTEAMKRLMGISKKEGGTEEADYETKNARIQTEELAQPLL